MPLTTHQWSVILDPSKLAAREAWEAFHYFAETPISRGREKGFFTLLHSPISRERGGESFFDHKRKECLLSFSSPSAFWTFPKEFCRGGNAFFPERGQASISSYTDHKCDRREHNNSEHKWKGMLPPLACLASPCTLTLTHGATWRQTTKPVCV